MEVREAPLFYIQRVIVKNSTNYSGLQTMATHLSMKQTSGITIL